jgi:very-short-patch-repair endonuclease
VNWPFDGNHANDVLHAREAPGRTLGVATFSVAQRQAIQNELEILRREHPDTEEFFGRGASEPFFVKNLENIQGDERDVILISLGYGRTKEGFISMSFGPLNSDGGERRLNVLISRAKLRCEVFSSITGDDIDLSRSKGRGVAALKMFLSFAQTGKLGIAEETGRDADSIFEEQVAARLTALGHDVKTQIGTAGFFVDLAVSDPKKPGRFVLGIECDGAQYHSSRSARDRDRLRQNVLEAHGWVLHRIWSTDWFLPARAA